MDTVLAALLRMEVIAVDDTLGRSWIVDAFGVCSELRCLRLAMSVVSVGWGKVRGIYIFLPS